MVQISISQQWAVLHCCSKTCQLQHVISRNSSCSCICASWQPSAMHVSLCALTLCMLCCAVQALPQGLAGAVGMFRNWTFTLFFCMSELWGDVCMGLLFWG